MTAKSTADVMHPSWCEESRCALELGTLVHHGADTIWRACGGYAELVLHLERLDEPNDPQGVGETRIHLGIDNPEMVNSFADVYLNREDARLLIMFLQRHLEELERHHVDFPRHDSEAAR